MSAADPPRTLVIGVGNAYRSDDGVGPSIAREVRRKALRGVDVREESGEGAALMEAWRDAERVILVDAVSSGGAPGTIYRFEIPEETMPARFFNYSTHAFSVAEAVELGRALDLLPAHLTVFGIEGEHFASGEGLSDGVRRAAEEVVRQILEGLTAAKSH